MKAIFTTFFTCFSFILFSQIQSVYTNFQDNFDRYDLIFSENIDSLYFFIGKEQYNIPKLIVSDGTTAGTRVLDQVDNAKAIVFKNKLYYQKRVNQQYKIYVTDGSAGSSSVFADSVNNRTLLFATEDVLFFMKNNKLWRTDGTTANTYSISDNYQNSSFPRKFYAFLDKIYFETGINNRWLIEGNQIKSFDLVPSDIDLFFNGIELNGIYYTAGKDDIDGCELWRTDGTPQGTFLVKDLNPAFIQYNISRSAFSGSPRGFAILNNKIIFLSDLGIWTTDGTASGTTLIRPIEDVNHNYYNAWLDILFEYRPNHGILNGQYFIEIENTKHGNELWMSDGTAEGTYILDISKGSGDALEKHRTKPVALFDNYLYFEANNNILGLELWRTDGTIAGTTIMKDINSGVKGTNLLDIKNIGDKLLFISQTESEEMTTLYSFDKNVVPQVPIIDNTDIEWHKVIGETRTYNDYDMENQDLELDNEGNIFVLAQGEATQMISFFDDNYILPADSEQLYLKKNFIAKYNNTGELQWINYAHGDYFRKMSIAIDANNKIIIGGSLPDFSWNSTNPSLSFLGETILAPENVAYVAKLNQNGEKEWSYFLDGSTEEIFDVITDNQNNIFVLSRTSLIKLDKNGNLIWKKTLFTLNYNRDGFLKLDNQSIYIATSNNNNTQGTDCGNAKFLQVIKHSLEGALTWKKQFRTTGFVSVNDFAISPEGQLAIVGDYTENFMAPPYEILSSKTNCREKAGFHLRMDKNGHVIQLINDTISSHIYNITFNDNQQYYTVSEVYNKTYKAYDGFENYRNYPTNREVLSVKKYNHLHQIIEERTFNLSRDDTNTKLKLTDDKILLSGVHYERFDTLPYHLEHREQNIRLIKFELNNAPSPKPTWEKSQSLSISISPNPTRGFINIRVIEPAFLNYDLHIYNAKGQIVGYFEKNDDAEYAAYYLNNYETGVYFFRFRNDEEVLTKKVILLTE